MNAILIKIFAVALTLSQVTTRSDIKTEFDPTRDRAEVAQLLRDGCAHMLKAFDVENINIDELIAVAMNDPKAVEGESKVFRGINLDDLVAAYRQFCKAEAVDAPIVDVGDIIAFYNKATTDLPDVTRLKEQKLRGLNVIFDGKGKRFADDYQPGPAPLVGSVERRARGGSTGLRGGRGQTLLRTSRRRRARVDTRLRR